VNVPASLRSALAALLLAALAVLLPLPATRAEAASCSGVWVVVESSVQCATSHSTGLDALRSAGFSVETIGTGYVCRIDGSPSTCTMATPYWSYWHATRNADGTWGDWQYAQRGASTYAPPTGSAEGWAFGDGTPPSGTPPASATTSTTTTRTTTTTTTTKPATSSSSTTTSKATTNSSTSQPAGSSSSQPAGSTSTQPAGGTSSSQPSGSSAPTAVGSSPAPAPAPVTPGAVTAGGEITASASGSAGSVPHATGTPVAAAGGSPVGVLATAGVVLLGGAGLGAVAWRARRR